MTPTRQELKPWRQFGSVCRQKGMTLHETNVAVARKVGIINTYLDAAEEGWRKTDELMSPVSMYDE